MDPIGLAIAVSVFATPNHMISYPSHSNPKPAQSSVTKQLQPVAQAAIPSQGSFDSSIYAPYKLPIRSLAGCGLKSIRFKIAESLRNGISTGYNILYHDTKCHLRQGGGYLRDGPSSSDATLVVSVKKNTGAILQADLNMKEQGSRLCISKYQMHQSNNNVRDNQMVTSVTCHHAGIPINRATYARRSELPANLFGGGALETEPLTLIEFGGRLLNSSLPGTSINNHSMTSIHESCSPVA